MILAKVTDAGQNTLFCDGIAPMTIAEYHEKFARDRKVPL